MDRSLIYTLVLASLLACTCALAQVPPEVRAFEEAAGGGSVLFRGKQAESYDRPANGNPYWTSSEFVPGTVVFEGNIYDGILVNIDAVDGRALVRKADNPIAVALLPASVGSIRTGDGRKFEGFGPDADLPEGFYQVLGEGRERVYVHVAKRLQSSSGNVNGDQIGYYDPRYNPDLTLHYAISRTYYFRDGDGVFSRIKGRRALLRKFPEQRREIRSALAAAGLDRPGTAFEDYCLTVLNTVAR